MPSRTRSAAPPPRISLAPEPMPADFVHDAILQRWEKIETNERAAQQGDIEALHDVRVATRRLRAATRIFRCCLPEKRARRARRRLRTLTRALSVPREWDVHAQRLTALRESCAQTDQVAAIEHVLVLVDARRRIERRKLRRRLRKIDLQAIGKVIRGLAEHVRTGGLPERLAELAWEGLRPGVEKTFESLAGLSDVEKPDELHALRIEVKRLRYAVELLTPAMRIDPGPLLARLKNMQEQLGAHHDLVLLGALLEAQTARLLRGKRYTLAAGLSAVVERMAHERVERFRSFVASTAHDSAESIGAEIRRGLALRDG